MLNQQIRQSPFPSLRHQQQDRASLQLRSQFVVKVQLMT